MRSLDVDPICVTVTHDYRLRRKILVLPQKTAGALCFSVWLFSGIIAVTAHRLGWTLPLLLNLLIGYRFWFLLAWCILWRVSIGKKTHQGDPLGDCVEHLTFKSDRLVCIQEADGVKQEKNIPYSRLYQVIETKDALFLYHSPTDASVFFKADLHQGEPELLKETVLSQIDQTPPLKRQVYRHL